MFSSFSVYATCAPTNGQAGHEGSLREIENAARWSEDAGCAGILVYTDNGLADPWLVSEVVMSATQRLAPLVAVQPLYMHPYTAAKMITTLGLLKCRSVHLNMLAGGFKNDLIALGDNTPHERRYDRTTEYTTVLMDLLRGEKPVSFSGDFYHTENLKLTPPLPKELLPKVLLSGSSEAGLAASRRLGATAIQYPQPPDKYTHKVSGDTIDYGIRIGIIARSDSAEAWRIAEERYPEDRKGQITHQLSMKVSDSTWHRQLSELGSYAGERNPYWLRPFENYKTFCPYLVGSYEEVAEVVHGYLDLGYKTFILDVPGSPDDFEHSSRVFELAEGG